MNETIIQKNICDFAEDSHIFQLLKEIDLVAGYPLDTYIKQGQVVHYLLDVWSKKPINKQSLTRISDYKKLYLNTKIAKFKDTEIYSLCCEIAMIRSIEPHTIDGKTLYVFLGTTFQDSRKRKLSKQNKCRGCLAL